MPGIQLAASKLIELRESCSLPRIVGTNWTKEATMKIEFLSFLEWSLQLSILLNVFMAGLCGFLVYQDRQAR
jgi:hypothetical protein